LQVTTTFNGLIGKPGVPEITLRDEDLTIFQALLGKEETRVANPEFITGLFKDDVPNKRLERHIIRHCAFYLKAGELADWKVWLRSLKADDRSRTVVVLRKDQLAELSQI
jgi:hypothetical protein